MKITTKSRYALRMMIDLAMYRHEGYIALKDIAGRQNLSKKYLEQIVPMLNAAKFLKANRGPQGGYKLAREPREYTVGEILRITESSLSPVLCAGQNPEECRRHMECPTFPVWRGLTDVINEYLDGITLQDILDQQEEMVG